MPDDDDVSKNTRGTVHRLELRLAEVLGVDGDGGRFGTLEETVEKHETRIAALETFNLKLGVLKTLVLMAGGIVAALALKLFDKLL